jgi:hypothetical protein
MRELGPGARVGHYEILATIGAGGMPQPSAAEYERPRCYRSCYRFNRIPGHQAFLDLGLEDHLHKHEE